MIQAAPCSNTQVGFMIQATPCSNTQVGFMAMDHDEVLHLCSPFQQMLLIFYLDVTCYKLGCSDYNYSVLDWLPVLRTTSKPIQK